VCVCAHVSLNVIRRNNNPLHLQWAGRRGQTANEKEIVTQTFADAMRVIYRGNFFKIPIPKLLKMAEAMADSAVWSYMFLKLFIIFSGSAAQRGLRPFRVRGFLITHNDAPESVGLLWTRDQLVAETST
jgi:hypothetical protein